jgi:hypothetical protein
MTTYTLEELALKVNFTIAFLKVVTKQLKIDITAPICEDDAKRVADRLKRPWPPE